MHLFFIFNTLHIPLASYPSIGQVANPFEVQPNMYVMATNIVFFCDHVVDEVNVGNSCIFLGRILLNNLYFNLSECNVRVMKESMDTPNRIQNEIGLDRNCGNGYPLENSSISNRNLSNAFDDSVRRVRDVVFVVDVDVVDISELVSSLDDSLLSTSTLDDSLLLSIFFIKNLTNR